jgi:hypothetical protein
MPRPNVMRADRSRSVDGLSATTAKDCVACRSYLRAEMGIDYALRLRHDFVFVTFRVALGIDFPL